MMVAIREEKKLAFFFPNGSPEWTQCFSMGPPAARELCPIPKTMNIKLSAHSVGSSEWSERAVNKAVCVCLRPSAVTRITSSDSLA